MADDATSPTSFAAAAELLNDNAPFLAEARAIVAGQQAEADRIEAECQAGRGFSLPQSYDQQTGGWIVRRPVVETVEACAARLAQEGSDRLAYLASDLGKARKLIARGCAVAAEVNCRDAYAAFEAVSAALSRGDGSAVGKVAELQDVTEKLADLSVAATELKLLIQRIQKDAA